MFFSGALSFATETFYPLFGRKLSLFELNFKYVQKKFSTLESERK